MNNINDLILKGHFQELKENADVISTYQEAMHKNYGSSMPSEDPKVKCLLDLVRRAVASFEEIIEGNPGAITPDHACDYKEMVEILNQFGVSHIPHKGLIERATIVNDMEHMKMPMQKAKGKKSSDSQKYGS